MTDSLVHDAFDGRRTLTGDGIVREFCDATILSASDARTALTLAEVVGGAEPAVVLGIAFAVRAVRLGHVYVDLTTVSSTVVPEDEEEAVHVASLPWPEPTEWLGSLSASSLVAIGEHDHLDRPVRLVGSHLYLDRYWRYERTVADDLRQRSHGDAPDVNPTILADGLERLFGADRSTPDGAGGEAVDLQQVAAATAVLRRFAVVAGGPGTGKTTTVARILALLYEQAAAAGVPPPRVALAAPTGKAAARLAEAVHAEAATLDTDEAIRSALLATGASTVHRLLGYQPGRHRFRHDPTNQLPHDVVVVDESSMVSLWLMAKLLDAVRASTRMILVGDPRQLASVEAGAVLGDVVGPAANGLRLRPMARAALEAVLHQPIDAIDPGPDVTMGDGIVVLERVHRFGEQIAHLAQAIEDGDADTTLELLRSSGGDIGWIEVDTMSVATSAPELAQVRASLVAAARSVVDAARDNRSVAALRTLRSVQVLCAHRRGPAGASTWRAEIERLLRFAIPDYAGGPWYAGRPLIITENDYGLGVFNGDTAVVVDVGNGRLRAVFERRDGILEIRPSRLAAVDSLYAITIHKAQGSQFGSVVVVLPDESSPVLTRELLYTAVTRAQEQLTVVGTEAAIRTAVARAVARGSGLEQRLWGVTPSLS